jgi:hypothetical protein
LLVRTNAVKLRRVLKYVSPTMVSRLFSMLRAVNDVPSDANVAGGMSENRLLLILSVLRVQQVKCYSRLDRSWSDPGCLSNAF